MSQIRPGKYRHYKGKDYRVIGVANHSENLEEFVIYQQLYDSDNFSTGTLWVRPRSIFEDEVEVNGRKVPHFKFLKK